MIDSLAVGCCTAVSLHDCIEMQDLLAVRSDLKLIVMSATLNAADFLRYFPGAGTVHIPGFTCPVQHLHLADALNASDVRFDKAPVCFCFR
jgi:HrpA-like RNA helicase